LRPSVVKIKLGQKIIRTILKPRQYGAFFIGKLKLNPESILMMAANSYEAFTNWISACAGMTDRIQYA
jgi:hypothetical protein